MILLQDGRASFTLTLRREELPSFATALRDAASGKLVVMSLEAAPPGRSRGRHGRRPATLSVRGSQDAARLVPSTNRLALELDPEALLDVADRLARACQSGAIFPAELWDVEIEGEGRSLTLYGRVAD